jgi:tripartite-type tricarboxylate transporter receptor subunit TctC
LDHVRPADRRDRAGDLACLLLYFAGEGHGAGMQAAVGAAPIGRSTMNIGRVHWGWKALSTALLVGAGFNGPAGAQGFYRGKTLTIIVGTDVGGGFDVYGRAIGRHIGRHLPGAPNIVIQNMPGAGSMKAAEYLYEIAPKDGTTIGIIFPGAIVEPLSAPEKFRYDPTRFGYLGTADSGTRLCITHHTSKIKTFADAQTIPSTIGGISVGSSTTDYANMFNALAGTKFKVVNGYKSSLDIMLAIERGEVDAICGYDTNSFKAQKPEWYGTPLANIIVQAGLEPMPAMNQLGVPSIWNYVSGENRTIAELIVSQQVFGRPFATAPGIPDDRLAMLRTAFMATLADPIFLDDAQKMKLDINPKDGAEVGALVKKIYATPRPLVDRMMKVLRP